MRLLSLLSRGPSDASRVPADFAQLWSGWSVVPWSWASSEWWGGKRFDWCFSSRSGRFLRPSAAILGRAGDPRWDDRRDCLVRRHCECHVVVGFSYSKPDTFDYLGRGLVTCLLALCGGVVGVLVGILIWAVLKIEWPCGQDLIALPETDKKLDELD